MPLTYVFVRLNVPEENTAKVLSIVEELTATTVQEDGCLYYKLRKEESEGNRYLLLEKWESKDHLDAHQKAEHFVRLVPQLVASCEITSLLNATDHYGSLKAYRSDISGTFSTAVRLIVTVKVKDEVQFIRLASELTDASNAEDGCIEYSFARIEGSADEYAFVELWKSDAALDTHSASDHCKRLIPALDGCSTVVSVNKSYEVFSA
jgi:quinol monooxygenase YgiN